MSAASRVGQCGGDDPSYSVVVPGTGSLFKRLLLGRAMRSDKLGETLLPKRLALPIFASDALSSVAYAPDEILLMLGLAGGAFVATHSWQVTIAVVLVMVVVVASYRQNVHAYPSGGGDYEVATVNLGPRAGLTVASALLVDYVLTVAVSISSGVQNAATVLGFVRGHEVIVAVALIAFLTAMNLRGVRESGKAFAVPVYAFMLAIIGMGIYGFIQHFTGTLTPAESAGLTLEPEEGQGLTGLAAAFLLLRAFSSGCAALTGVEAISQRRAGLQEAEEHQRRDDPAAHGRRCRSSCSGRSSRSASGPASRSPTTRAPSCCATASRSATPTCSTRPSASSPSRCSRTSTSASSSSRSSPA